jgi:LacI family transcriptional regulator
MRTVMAERTASRGATIRDVARLAGVSTSTVSRVLDDRHPPSTSPSAERVRAAAAELGYRPDAYASGLRRQHTGTIGVLVPRLSDTVMAMFFEEVARVCARQAGFAIVAQTEDRPETEKDATETLLRQRVDGLILTTARLEDPVAAQLRAQGVPHVLALRTDHISPTALGDDELGGYLATRHLLDLGHRDIALVAGPSYASTAVARQAGYRRAMAEAGLLEVGHLIHESTFGMDSGETVARAVLGGPHRPTAIFAVNDNTAIGVLAAAQAAGLSVPDDLSVVGYNDIPVSARLPVALTTVRVPFDRIAANAVELLSQQLTGALGEPGRVAAPTLIPRQSTSRPPASRTA